MPKYKKVNEGVVDRLIGAIFTKVGKGLESATIRKISKVDPELGKQFQDLQKTKKRLEKTLSKKTKQQIARGEMPSIFTKDLS
tara:strand:+ start:656 stop:904 length:249 start_codon:yes stop_codon:yes gene_type:complete